MTSQYSKGAKMASGFAGLYDPLLEWAYDHAGESSLGDVDLTPFATDHGLTEQQAFELLRYGKGKGGLDDRFATMGVPAANLTPFGIEVMEDRLRRRASPFARSAAARRALLRWLWSMNEAGTDFPVVDKILEADDSLFEGSRLTVDEIDRAAAHLKAKGLIEGHGVDDRQGPVLAQITAEGQDCVEHFDGDPAAYERRNAATNTTFNIGSNTGNIAANSRDFTLNATTHNGIAVAELVMLARALRQAAPILDLPESDAAEVVDLATRLEDEAQSESPDAGRLRQWGQSIMTILNSPAVSGALGNVLAEYAAGVLPGLG
jgi:hypothetical protein